MEKDALEPKDESQKERNRFLEIVDRIRVRYVYWFKFYIDVYIVQAILVNCITLCSILYHACLVMNKICLNQAWYARLTDMDDKNDDQNVKWCCMFQFKFAGVVEMECSIKACRVLTQMQVGTMLCVLFGRNFLIYN